jgi:hypothetical protein
MDATGRYLVKLTVLITLVGALALAPTVRSYAGPVANETGPNLVTNGSFEDTSAIAGSSWTVTGGFVTEGFDYFVDTNSADAQSGSHSFAGGAIGGLGFISQHIATAAGQSYNIHLWLANLSGFADNTAIQVLWGGSVVYSDANILGFSYREIVIDPIATSTDTVLAIGLRDDSFFLNVDSISVRQARAEAGAQVPEPATLALLGLGLAGLGFLRRKP